MGQKLPIMLRRNYKVFIFAISSLFILVYIIKFLITKQPPVESIKSPEITNNHLSQSHPRHEFLREDTGEEFPPKIVNSKKREPSVDFVPSAQGGNLVGIKAARPVVNDDDNYRRNNDIGIGGMNSRNGWGLPQAPSQTKLKIPYKLVHIDLKGAPPKIGYLKEVFKIIQESGGNAILLEYEDMFPFRGFLNSTTHKFHYTDAEIRELILAARESDLEIIPLVQTFGHLEFVLKLEQFSSMREVSEFPQEICPSNEDAWKMVQEIIDQVMEFHQPTPYSYLHIGCDEVYHLGECNKCKGKDLKDLFLGHVIRVARYVKTKYGVTSIIWDDMLRKFYSEELIKSGIGSAVEVMMWDYTEDVDRLLSPHLWPMYTQVFPNIWVASAYKGAFGESLYKVDIHRHATNHLSWLRVIAREEGRIRNLRGIALTGWSRYDHFSVLCELLPVAIPSLVLALQILEYQDFDAATRQMFKLLNCEGGRLNKLEECQWNGVELYNLIGSLEFFEEQTTSFIKSHRKEKGWLTQYNVKHNYTSPWRLVEPIQSASQYLSSLKTYESNLQFVLAKFFPQHVITEWLEQRVGSLISELELIVKDATSLSSRRVWGRRPI